MKAYPLDIRIVRQSIVPRSGGRLQVRFGQWRFCAPIYYALVEAPIDAKSPHRKIICHVHDPEITNRYYFWDSPAAPNSPKNLLMRFALVIQLSAVGDLALSSEKWRDFHNRRMKVFLGTDELVEVAEFFRLGEVWHFNASANGASARPSQEQSGKLPSRQIIIGGSPKSGTTWLEIIFNNHEDCLIVGESNFLGSHDLPSEPLEKIAAEESSPVLQKELQARSDVRYFRALAMQQITNELGALWKAKVVGDRSPGNTAHYEDFLQLLPESFVLHIVRHPLDVFISRLHHERMLWMRNAPHLCNFPISLIESFDHHLMHQAEKDSFIYHRSILDDWMQQWAEEQRNYLKVRKFYPDRVALLRYEDLTKNFKSCIEAIFNRLGLRTSKQMLERIARDSSFQVLSAGRDPGLEDKSSFFRKGTSGDHLEYLSNDLIKYAMECASDCASAFNY